MSIDMALCYSYRPSRKGSVGVRPYGAATPAMRKNFALFREKAGMIPRICPLLTLFFCDTGIKPAVPTPIKTNLFSAKEG